MAESTTAVPKPQVEPEPQNELTKKFTDKEWAAIKEFRTALPLLLEEAFPEESDARFQVVDMWGVKIDPGRVDDARVSVILLKFIRATDFDVQKAMERFSATVKWRHQFKIESLLTETFPEEVFGKVGHVFGHGKEGRPITYNVYGGDVDIQAVFSDLERFLRWRVQLMEQAMRRLDFETVDTLIQVHDYAGVGRSSRTEQSKKAATEATHLFSEHFPECLHVKFFVNVPSWLAWIYWVFKPLVPTKTFARLKVVGPGSATIGKELLPYIDESQLPTIYGGKSPGFK